VGRHRKGMSFMEGKVQNSKVGSFQGEKASSQRPGNERETGKWGLRDSPKINVVEGKKLQKEKRPHQANGGKEQSRFAIMVSR